MGLKALRSIQLGKETTAGTAVAATAIWRGTGVMDDQSPVQSATEDVGFLAPVVRTYIPHNVARLSMDPVEATFEQLPYIFEAGVAAEVATQDGTGSDYIYVYDLPTTAARTLNVYTIEAGDDQQFQEMEYGFVERFRLTGNAGEAVMMSADWVGRQTTDVAKTGALSLPAVEEMLASKAKVYIDAIGGTVGTTQYAGDVLGFSLEVVTGWRPMWTLDGNLYFNTNRATPPLVTLELTLEFDATAVTERTNWQAETARLVQLRVEGSAVATAGTTYSVKTFHANLAGFWRRFEPMGDADGNNIVVARFEVGYHATPAYTGLFRVVNELSALT